MAGRVAGIYKAQCLSPPPLQVREMMGHIHDSLSTQPRAVEELRAVLDASMQRTQDDMEHVQRSISGRGWRAGTAGGGLVAGKCVLEAGITGEGQIRR